MSQVRVICPNHGIINTIEMAVTWIGRPPNPEVDFAFCPTCGSKTVIERDTYQSDTGYATSLTQKELEAIKRKEIEFYRHKYFGERT